MALPRWGRPALAVAGLVALAAWEQAEFSAGFSRALGDAARAAAAGAVLFGVCGHALARLLVPQDMRDHTTLLAFPIGAAAGSISLAALGLAHVPFGVSLPVVLGTATLGGVMVHVRRGPLAAADGVEVSPRRGPPAAADGVEVGARRGPPRAPLGATLWPLWVAAVVAVVALSPVWRTGFATVVGQNGDAVLAVGSAELVRHAPPTAVRAELPVDRVPLAWRSKYPIFYALAAVSELSGLSPIAALPLLSAGMLAMAAFGFFCLARYALRAPPWVALAAMAAVGLGWTAVRVADHPFYNQLWALFALPFVLVAGAAFLRAPSRASAGLLALFGAIGAFAYPLMLAFPVLFLAVAGWRERARLPRARPGWGWLAGAAAGAGVLAVLLRGVFEKTAGAVVALSPWGDLGAWSGSAVLLHPFHRFFGLVDPGGSGLVYLALAALLAAAAWGLWRAPRDVGVPLAVTVAAALAFGVYFRHRTQAELFYFKDMGFAAPLAVTLAVVGLVDLARRRRGARVAALAAAAALAGLTVASTRQELLATHDYASRGVLELRDWSRRLPPGASVRIDLPPGGHQLWADYMLADRPVSASRPLVGFFPYAPPGRRADYVLASTRQRRPRDAAGAPLFANRQFRLWRMRPGVPGPDTSSRRMIDSVTEVNIV